MTREEIQNKYMSLMKEILKDNCSRHIHEELDKLRQSCSHPYGLFNYEAGFWMCPDCGKKG